MSEQQLIPMLDLAAEHAAMSDELMAAVERVVLGGSYILGPEVAAFEAEVTSYLGCRHAIGLNSGTDAIVIGLRALGVGPGDEVVTTPFTFFATAEGISNIGATPVFADIDPVTLNIDPNSVRACVTERTRAIVPVHLFGRPAAMSELSDLARQHDLVVFEDAAQAFGATGPEGMAGTLGGAGGFSFFPSKSPGALGDAGMLVTNDDAVAATTRQLRAHGATRKYFNEQLGYNSRLDEIQAAILRVKLRHLDASTARRREIAAAYTSLLAGEDRVVTPPEGDGCVWHQYTLRIRSGDRDGVAARMREAGVATMTYYPVPVHRLPTYVAGAPVLDHAERAAAEVLSLPIGPMLSDGDLERVVTALQEALA